MCDETRVDQQLMRKAIRAVEVTSVFVERVGFLQQLRCRLMTIDALYCSSSNIDVVIGRV